MLLSFHMPFPISANFLEESKHSQEPNIAQELLEAFEEDEYVPFIVILNDQTDVRSVSKQAKERAKDHSLSSSETKAKVQEAVVNELQTNAHSTQKDIVNYLDNHKKIKDYQSFYIVNAVAVTGTKEVMQEIAEMPEVKSILLDRKRKLSTIKENSLHNNLDDVEWNIDRVGAPDAWEKGITGKDVVIASIDSGVNWEHPALKEQYRGFNPNDPENPTHEFNWYDAVMDRKEPTDIDNHGTHTVGTMVGQGHENENHIGVAPEANWIAVRAFYMDEGYDHHILDAAEWVLAPKDKNGVPHPEKAPDIVNNSWGGNNINNDWFLPMVEAWRAVGIVPVFSVGNAGLFEDTDPGSASAPGNYEESIAVGATDEDDILAEFSLRGPSETGVIKPDLVAPGVNIRSSIPDDRYSENDGTSMAAPHVSGTISLMLEADPHLTVEQIEDVLKVTAVEQTDDEYPETPNYGYGYGLLNASAAVEATLNGISTIAGQITIPGKDEENPTFEHDDRKILFKNKDEEFMIQAGDNVSVKEVTLEITFEDGKKQSYVADRIKGDHRDGIYQSIVNAEEIEGDSLDYKWKIEDFSGNITETDSYTVEIKEGVREGYLQDFESYPDGWYSFGRNNSWEWGIPTYGPEHAPSGERVVGTNLKGLYDMNSEMTLMMPPVFVEEQTVLRFKNWYQLPLPGQDTGTVYISTDQENWDPLYQVRQENTRWHEIGLDLSEYAGEKVYIAFHFESADNEDIGWYIDDVRIERDDLQQDDANVSESFATIQLPDQQKDFLNQFYLQRIGKEDRRSSDNQDEENLPAEATITVEETGWKTETDLSDGTFAIHHEPGEYTLNIDAYGYEQETKTVTIDTKETVSLEMLLTPLPRQTVSGTITSSTGEKIEDATIFLVEDQNNERAQSNEDGTYQLDSLEGTYTLKVYAEGYKGVTQEVTVQEGKDIDLDITLDPFYTSDDSEISYDNGFYDKNLAFAKAGNGFAVKMSLAENESSALLTGAKLQFWADHIPNPGGNDISIVIYDAEGEDGSPGNLLAGPIEAEAVRDLDQWTEVDLSHLGITVQDDFYIAYLQADDYPYIPGFVADGDSSNYEDRSWIYVGGEWYQSDADSGNFMIRATVDYGETKEYDEPTIITPSDEEFTNKKHLTIEGNATPNTVIAIRNNDQQVESGYVDEEGQFSIDVTLEDGKNELQAVTLVEDEPVSQSDIVTVTLDTIPPDLYIDNPTDGETLIEGPVLVEGVAEDLHLENVLVNGEKADVDENHYYQKEILLEKGEQTIEVTAEDKAGNISHEEITVFVKDDQEKPVLTNIKPEHDVYLETGESVEISFDSEENLRSSFIIHFPDDDLLTHQQSVELPLIEMPDGHYIGYWTVSKDIVTSGAQIEVRAVDQEGNETRKMAKGRLNVNTKVDDKRQTILPSLFYKKSLP